MTLRRCATIRPYGSTAKEDVAMPSSQWDRRAPLIAGVAFLVLAVAGNAMQGSTPALHGDADAVVLFYSEKSTLIAIAMMLSLISVFFLAWFLTILHRALEVIEGRDGWASQMAWGGGIAAVALLAGGFALNSAGALRAREAGSIPPESAVVFYDGSLAMTGLGATLAMAVLLAPTAFIILRMGGFPRWFGWVSAALAGLGIVTPLSFILFLTFPLWVVAASILLFRRPAGPPRAG